MPAAPGRMALLPSSVMDWSTTDTKTWLTQVGLAKYTTLLCDTHNIDGPSLLMLQEEDLRQQPIKMEVLGDIKKLSFHLNQLRYEFPCSDAKVRYCLTQGRSPQSGFRQHSSSSDSDSQSHGDGYPDYADGFQGENVCISCDNPGIRSNIATNLPKERWKAGLSFVYVLFVSFATAFVMTLVHDRVPDMNKYPPLPDLILDNVPHIPWAFMMCEVSGMVLLSLWLIVLLFHKHRFILATRWFSITGTIFLLRCVTMLITSLSVPGVHLDCRPRPYSTWSERLNNSYVIWSGAGMSIQGVRTCGDYMFSGHTVNLTLLNFFITEYSSRRIYWLHTFTWLCNLFGIFFILAAHEHYSIDVFVAFYISSRLFLYYHTLANNKATPKMSMRQGYDAARTWFYFPLFSFFEHNINGRVPNEFELPLFPSDVWTAGKKIAGALQSKMRDNGSNGLNEAVEKKEKRKRR